MKKLITLCEKNLTSSKIRELLESLEARKIFERFRIRLQPHELYQFLFLLTPGELGKAGYFRRGPYFYPMELLAAIMLEKENKMLVFPSSALHSYYHDEFIKKLLAHMSLLKLSQNDLDLLEKPRIIKVGGGFAFTPPKIPLYDLIAFPRIKSNFSKPVYSVEVKSQRLKGGPWSFYVNKDLGVKDRFGILLIQILVIEEKEIRVKYRIPSLSHM